MDFLEVTGLQMQEDGHTVLHGISFRQGEYEKLAIAGETGSGKSTLLQAIAGLVQPSAGQITFEGKRVIGPHDKLVPGHEGIAYLSQHYDLPQFLRVEQVLRYANILQGDEAETLYEVCRISHLKQRKTHQLSGGERQRIALARLLSTWPSLLLLDEPYSNLDKGHKELLKEVIHDITERLAITCILISHDPHDTLSWADRILIIKGGRMVQQGTPEQVYRHPVDAYTAGLFGNYNLIPAHVALPFAEKLGIAVTARDLLVRPEHFRFVAKEAGSLNGTVQKVTFFGGYYDVQVQVTGFSVTVRTQAIPATVGDQVYLAVKQEDIRFV
ncbi:ABC transporter ATP-binding protein [Pontibacter ramchanderi]|uniref:Iron(III) transport system ATP-binding protein n=1 Tax=Pontibacter ramchanderi TaxID=1179743 RepID=A0A2N3V403_9BACT|nr:ABC transporter ATP-binding protein [Pontibacter ramchanderi]PKV76286.1 iron(III) transport system ATP-binding protein [Pontibacter ramchanderi]